MTLDDHPLLNTPSLVAAILHAAAAGPAGLERIASKVEGALQTANEDAGVPEGWLRRELQSICDDLMIAGLVTHSDAGFRLTARGREAVAEHPQGLDRSDLAQWPEYAEHVHRLAATAKPKDDPHHAAYNQGASARVAGRPVTDNPHPPDTADHGAWEDGWAEVDIDGGG